LSCFRNIIDAIIPIIMLARLQSILQQFPDLDLNRSLLLGLSGGPDSLVLLDLLSRLDYPLSAAHFDHSLRDESGVDAQRVGEIALSRNLPFFLGKGDVRAFSVEESLSIEEAARILRYRFLFSKAREVGAQAVVVAHTADDQVETILMHLLRGTGLSGLKGMDTFSLPNEWSQDIILLRPLLDIWREDVINYCQENDLNPVTDPSNREVTFFRNRLRHELLPYLETFNPAVRRSIWKTARVLKGDDELLERMVEREWSRAIHEKGPGYVSLHLSILKEQPVGLQRRLLRKALAMLRPGLRDISFDMVERGLHRLEGKKTGLLTDLGSGLYIYVEGDIVWVANWEAELPTSRWPQLELSRGRLQEKELHVPGSVQLRNGWEMHAAVMEDINTARKKASQNQDPYTTWLDSFGLQFPLLLRPRKPGDRFQPLGMEGSSIKVSDLMINEKIPKRVRRAWPLVVAGEIIVWVPGLRPAHQFRLLDKTDKVVQLTLKTP
jgi:tRNA(Ile)-lysidine synthase